jgi:hypothetical protein
LKAARSILALAALSGTATSAAPQGWCTLDFKDVAHEAHAVVLAEVPAEVPAEVRREKRAPRTLRVVEVLKGELPREELWIDPDDLGDRRIPRDGRVLLALDEDLLLVGSVKSMGACNAISVLPIHDGKLRSRDRSDYDSGSGAMTLEQVRRDLADAKGRFTPVR